MTQFKDKSPGQRQVRATAGLLVYPVLQAADILLYQTERVLVGEDQRQHLELARTLADRFNRRFGHAFTAPRLVIPTMGARIMDMQDPQKKMAKSSESQHGTLHLMDTPEVIEHKVRTAITDSGRQIVASGEKPSITNLLNIHSALTGEGVQTVEEKFAKLSYERFKAALAEGVIETLRPIRERYRNWVESKDKIV